MTARAGVSVHFDWHGQPIGSPHDHTADLGNRIITPDMQLNFATLWILFECKKHHFYLNYAVDKESQFTTP